MKRLQELRRRLRSLDALSEVVGVMKTLSAHHFREARAAVEPARRYRDGIEQVLSAFSVQLPAGQGGAGLLVIGGELGLCGGYNAQLVRFALDQRKRLGTGPTLCVGRRITVMLQRHGLMPDQSHPAPASIRGITDLLLRLAEEILATYARADLASFDVASSRFLGVGVHEPTLTRLLPLLPETARTASKSPYVTRHTLERAIIREVLYIRLHDLLLDAQASEHGARIVATQAAESWLAQRTKQLRGHLAAAHRELSTQEMLDIAGGVRARRGR